MNRLIRLAWQGRCESGAVEAPVPDQALNRTRFESAPSLFHRVDGPPGTPSGDLYRGNNVEVLRALLPAHSETVSLAYMDPPFFTGREHDALVREDTGPKKLGHARAKQKAFDDRWADRAEYLDALALRVSAIRPLLAPHGSLVIHVDPKTSHYVKVLTDEIFGDDCFASEIIWRYRRWPSKTPNFQRVHDVLLRYRKSPDAAPRWNQPYEPLASSTLATWGTRQQRAVVDATGRRARSSSTDVASPGVPMGDVWDIGVIAPIATERTGYPSQKPERLLERIISALSDPGDVVLDPYVGSGTTVAVAARLGRKFIGIDEGEVAIRTTTQRLERTGLLPTTGAIVG